MPKEKTYTKFDSYSQILPGEDNIHTSIFSTELTAKPPDETVTTLYENFQRAARITNNAEALGERSGARKKFGWIRYQEVLNRAQRIGSYLLKLGLKPGEDTRIGICGINRTEYVISIYGCMSYSMVVVPLFHNYHQDALSHIVNSCDLSVIFCDNYLRMSGFLKNAADTPCLKHLILMTGEFYKDALVKQAALSHNIEVHGFDDVLVIGDKSMVPVTPPKPENTYIISHTSGTTGMPKGIILTHANMVANFSAVLSHYKQNNLDISSSDVYLSYLPMAHLYEQLVQAMLIYCGAKIGFYSGDVQKLMDDMQTLKPTIIAMVPRLLNKFHDKIRTTIDQSAACKKWLFRKALGAKTRKLDKGQISNSTIWDKLVFRKIQGMLGGRVRIMSSGGAPISPAILRFSRAVFGCIVIEGYGQTEVTCAATMTMPNDTQGGHVGGPLTCCHIKLISVPEMEYLAEEGKGEVCFKGPSVMQGYYGKPELTAETVDSEGWLHTGDIGQWLTNGALKIIDRKKNIFKLAQGEFVSPENIENIYIQCPFVSQIFVTGQSLKSYLVGIVVPDFDVLIPWALKNEITTEEGEALCSNHKVKQHILTEMRVFGAEKGLSSLEQVKVIHLYPKEFAVEDELMTPTMKLRRPQMRHKFEEIIENMYKDVESY